MKEYKLGDRVTIKKDLSNKKKYGIYCSTSMEKYRGQTFFIVEIQNAYDKHYILSRERSIDYNKPIAYNGLRDWIWTSDMFEKVYRILDKIIKVKVLKVRRKV